MESRITVAIAEPRDMTREGMIKILKSDSGLAVAGEALSARQILELADTVNPDVIILSASLPGEDTNRLIRSIIANNETKVLIFGGPMPEHQLFEFLKNGANGYFHENSKADNLTKAVVAVHQGEMWVSRRLMTSFFQSTVHHDIHEQNSDVCRECGLSKREHEVLDCLRKGYCNKDIAGKLFISEKTVKTHLTNIFRKLEVTQRLEAIVRAVEQKII